LKSSNLGADSAVHIANLLLRNTSLTSLDLNGNTQISDQGAKLISEALKGNSTLKELDISFIGITCAGEPYISDIVANTRLQVKAEQFPTH